jgi:hypothetical protein
MPEPERRATERFPVNSNVSCPLVAPIHEDFGPVRIKDVSTDGIGLLLGRHVEVGTLLAVSVVNQARAFQKTLTVRVIHVTPVHGLFLIGGTFDVPLRYEELTALVM